MNCCEDFVSESSAWGRGFLTFGFVLVQSLVVLNRLLRQSLAKSQKSSLRAAKSWVSSL
jgi:hypothetical protein